MKISYLPAIILLIATSINGASAQERVTVTIDRARTTGTSRLSLGVTHTQFSLDTGGDAAAVARAKTLLDRTVRFQNAHIMGWGTMNPNPAPGVYDWASLDRRMEMIRSMKAEPVITLCAAPDWMKGGEAGKTDWKRIEAAPLPEHYADFAELAATVARRYPDVKYYQVWNEFKGFWDANGNNWDYKGYTRMYNLVYDALKAVNPKIQVGGPYLVVEGTGSERGDWSTEKPIRARQWEVVDYWLKNKRGAEFITLDRGLKTFHDKSSYTVDELMALTPFFESVARQVTAKTDLPLWWAEYYGALPPKADAKMVAAQHASILCHLLRGGSSVALLWQPMETGEINHALITDARRPDGGEPLPHYAVFQALHDHFGPGTRLVESVSSSPSIEALAGEKKTLLINKRATDVTVAVNGSPVALPAWGVLLIDTP